MKNEIKLFGEETTMSSREIAELTDKLHKNVLADCDSLNANYLKLNMAEISAMAEPHPTVQGRMIRVMHLTKMQTFDLITGYNTELRIKVNRRWEELENKQLELPKTFSEALMLAAKQAEKLELQEAKLKEQRPDVLFSKSVKRNGSDCLVGELAKIICQNGVVVGQNRLFEWLRDSGYLIKEGRQKNVPKQQYIESGLFRIAKGEVETKRGNVIITSTTMVTPKGQSYFVNKYLEDVEF